MSGREKNSTRIGLVKFCKEVEDYNNSYSHDNLFPCPVEGCTFFGLSKQLFKMKKLMPTYDLTRINGKVDLSEDAWSGYCSTDQFCLTLLRHFTFNIDPSNKGFVSTHMRESHKSNVPECLVEKCKQTKDKNYDQLKKLLKIDEDNSDDEE
jgi:hypothetical protein